MTGYAKGNQTQLVRAKQQYLALMLNIASGRLQPSTVVSDDGTTASQAIQYIAMLLLDGDASNDEEAKDLAEVLNFGLWLDAGAIPSGYTDIAYKNGADKPQPSGGTKLFEPAPSPFNPSTSIRFRLEASGEVDLVVYDSVGRVVRGLQTGWMAAGIQEIQWDGKNNAGLAAASGVYHFRLRAEGVDLVRSAVMLK